MKAQILSLAALLLVSFSTFAKTDGTAKPFYSKVPNNVHALTFEGYSDVVIVPDTAAYITFADSKATSAVMPSCTQQGHEYTIACNTGVPKLQLHIDMAEIENLTTKGHARVSMPCIQSKELTIVAKDTSRFEVTQNAPTDTLKVDYLNWSAKDNSTLYMDVPINASKYYNYIYDLGTNVHMNKADTKALSSVVDNYLDTSALKAGMGGRHYIFIDNLDDELDDPTPTPFKHICSHNDVSNTGLRFLWGFHNWGTTPYNGLSKMPAPYKLYTSFSDYQLEWNYRIYNGHYWHIGLGLGYASEVYKFDSKEPVMLVMDSNSNKYAFSTTCSYDCPTYDECATRLVARYITLPLEVIWSPNKDLHLSLTYIAGLNLNTQHTGLKYKYTEGKKTTKDYASTSDVMNSLKSDVRLSIGTDWIKFYIQSSLLPLFDGMDKQIYPIRFGLMIGE